MVWYSTMYVVWHGMVPDNFHDPHPLKEQRPDSVFPCLFLPPINDKMAEGESDENPLLHPLQGDHLQTQWVSKAAWHLTHVNAIGVWEIKKHLAP